MPSARSCSPSAASSMPRPSRLCSCTTIVTTAPDALISRARATTRSSSGRVTARVEIFSAHGGDGPILTGALAGQLRKHDPDQPTALRAWLTSHGWQLEPEPLCPAHSNSTKD